MIKPIFNTFLQQYGSPKNVVYVTENIGIPFFQVKLFLGAIGGELSAELPFVLMHPKPNMKKILKADTLAEVEGFQVRCDQRLVLYQFEPVTNDLHMRPLNYFTITISEPQFIFRIGLFSGIARRPGIRSVRGHGDVQTGSKG